MKATSREAATNVIAEFTVDEVHSILRGTLKGEDKLPAINDPSLVHLVSMLNLLQWKVRDWRGPLAAHHRECEEIKGAIQVIADVLPRHRAQYAEEIRAAERWEDDPAMPPGFRGLINEPRARLAATDALIAAAEGARELGLPFAHPTNVLAGAAERWQDVAPHIRKSFETWIGASKSGCYRFIKEVIPRITGEAPTYLAIETAFKKNRIVNRGSRRL